MSLLDRLGGVCSRVGGVDASDRPEDPAVEGLPSPESFLTTDFFRAGTPSGHVHYRKSVSENIMMGEKRRTSRWPCVQRIQFGFVSSHCMAILSGSSRAMVRRTDLDFFDPTGHAPRLATGIFGALALCIFSSGRR